mmetsp:Transcript_41119/g.113326  ORF Transcript_41119/g.113326 Transcript_41119/m.113326 type:complete len:239 (-) Transcript_41119:444-1160(-)
MHVSRHQRHDRLLETRDRPELVHVHHPSNTGLSAKTFHGPHHACGFSLTITCVEKPRIVAHVLRTGTFVRVLGQQSPYQLLRLVPDISVLQGRRLDGLVQDLLEDELNVITKILGKERMLARQQVVEQHSHGPHVTLHSVACCTDGPAEATSAERRRRSRTEDLWGDVAGRAQYIVHPIAAIVTRLPHRRKAEVDDLHIRVACGCEEAVLGLEIAVGNSAAVAIHHCSNQLSEDPLDF